MFWYSEHVWEVKILQTKAVEVPYNLKGHYLLCLTPIFLSLVKMDNPKTRKDFQVGTLYTSKNNND